MAGDNLITITDANFEDTVIKSDKLVIIDFWATWCGPCKMISPIVDELANEFQGRVKIGKMNVDENGSVPARFKIRSIPTLLFFKNGHKIKEIVGVVPKLQIISAINENM